MLASATLVILNDDDRRNRFFYGSEIRHEAIDSHSETGIICPPKARDSDGQHHVQLPRHTILRLEQLRQQTGKQTIADVVAEAAELYARMRPLEEIASQRLTPRHREVLRLVADGVSTKGIAARLKISVKTVEFHRARLMRKLGVRGIAGLVRYAIRCGVILP